MKDEEIYPSKFKNNTNKATWLPFILGAIYGLAQRILFAGHFSIGKHPLQVMSISFAIIVPLAIGAITIYLEEQKCRRSFGFYIFGPWLSTLFFLVGCAITLLEGSICIAMASPLFLFLSSIGGLIMGLVCRFQNKPRKTIQCIALLPFMIAYIEPTIQQDADSHEIKRSIYISASPDKVWQQVNFPIDIKPDELKDGLAFKIGVPYPIEARTLTTGVGGKRHLVWQRGVSFNEEIISWQENRHIAWKYLFDQNSFPPGSMDDHVVIGGQYFKLDDTAYTLTPENGGTRLAISVKYRVTTSFNWYTKPLSVFFTADTAETILKFYKNRVESEVKHSRL